MSFTPTEGNVQYITIFLTFPDPQSTSQTPRWDSVLKIPQYALHLLELPNQNWCPYLKYVCYAITGADGFLSTRQDPEHPQPPLPAELASPTASHDVYYHCTAAGFPVDMKTDDQTSATHMSARDPAFEKPVQAREGFSLLNALIGHAPQRTSYSIAKATPVPGILDSSDLHSDRSAGETLITAHFHQQLDYYPGQETLRMTRNQAGVIPSDRADEYPPHFLFDAVYAVFCVRQWGEINIEG